MAPAAIAEEMRACYQGWKVTPLTDRRCLHVVDEHDEREGLYPWPVTSAQVSITKLEVTTVASHSLPKGVAPRPVARTPRACTLGGPACGDRGLKGTDTPKTSDA